MLTRSLSTQMIIVLILVILVTTIAVGVPAYWLLYQQLEQNAQERLSHGVATTQTALNDYQTILLELASHVAQRPTLQTLVQEGDASELDEYLEILKKGLDLDLIVIHDASGKDVLVWTDEIPLRTAPYLSEAVLIESGRNDQALAWVASSAISGNPSLDWYVTVGIWLDEFWIEQLVERTGFEMSLLMDELRVATSLPLPMNTESNYKTGNSARLDWNGQQYYVSQIPLTNLDGKRMAVLEVALSTAELIANQRRALLLLGIISILVAGLGSFLGYFYARGMITPLKQLTEAATSISEGDFSTPIRVPKEPQEIVTLALAFRESRNETLRALYDLSEAKAWLETLVQSVREGIVTYDQDYRITSFNKGAEHITGCLSKDALLENLDKIFCVPEGGEPFSQQLPALGGKQPVMVLNSDGQQITLTVSSAQIILPGSSATQVALVLEDITEEMAAQSLRSYFLANISHEFRTPLSALNASVELLLDDLSNLSRDEIAQLLNSILFSLTGLQTLIDNLLESTSIEAGHFRVRRRVTDLHEVIEDAQRVMAPLFERRQQDFELDITDDIPLIFADPTRLTQVLVNLLSNASKYSPMGEAIKLHLSITEDQLVHVTVMDRGPGISESDRLGLFQRFVRLDDKDETQYGAGLGLSVVKAIVEGHGGEVGVDHRKNGGSIFWFKIPMEEA